MINLMLGDCLELMKDISDKSIDMILCDLPYGTTNCKWDVRIPFEPLWEQYKRVITDNGAICLFGSEPFSTLLRYSNLKMYKYDWIWEKPAGTNFLSANRQPLKNYEIISVFGKKQALYNPQFEVGEPYVEKRYERNSHVYGRGNRDDYTTNNSGIRYPKSILKFNVVNNTKRLHPTQKPVPLLEYLIKTYTNEGFTVLDNCMGSGSTGVACINTNRNFIGMELDKNYFDIAKSRIEETIKNKETGVCNDRIRNKSGRENFN